MMTNNVSIVAKGPTTQGTQVLVDGVPMKGVTKIELVADVNDVWRAVITCIPAAINISDMDSEYMEFVKGLPKQDIEGQ
jgi:hypothetical protein